MTPSEKRFFSEAGGQLEKKAEGKPEHPGLKKEKKPNPLRKERAKPKYSEQTKLAHRQGAILRELEKLDQRIRTREKELAEGLVADKAKRVELAEELKTLIAQFSDRAAAALAPTPETAPPEPGSET